MATDRSGAHLTADGKCRWCGVSHDGTICPIVKAYEFDADGRIVRVEFVTVADMATPRHEKAEPERDYPRLGEKKRTGC